MPRWEENAAPRGPQKLRGDPVFARGSGLAALLGMNLHPLALAAALSLAACAGSGDVAKNPSSGSPASSSAPVAKTTPPRTANRAAAPVAKKTKPAPTAAPTPTVAPAPTVVPAVYVASSASDDSTVHEHVADVPTVLSQGNSVAELKITAGIRRAVLFDFSLGFGARNIQIITMGTKVTLRGVVSSEHERSTIESHAKQQAGVSAVDDLITVKN